MEKISLIIPVYNRPQEVEELLASLACQSCGNFGVVVVEDGSSVTSEDVVDRYRARLDIAYHVQPNGGPASAKNAGATVADGDFLIFMDSDCLVPEGYMEAVSGHIRSRDIRFYGGPDKAAPDFSPLQKAISYSMTSFFTTGGIRGRKHSIGRFLPRSFNLGVEKELFDRVGGFSDMRFSEDIDFSKKVIAAGVMPVFLADAAVYHKRRTSMRLFFKQVFVFGVGRINLDIRYPADRKPIYYLPLLFTLGSLALIVCSAVWSWWFLFPLLLACLIWFTDSALRNRSIRTGWLSIWTSFIQLYGYGAGNVYGIWLRCVKRLPEEATWKVTGFFSRKTR